MTKIRRYQLASRNYSENDLRRDQVHAVARRAAVARRSKLGHPGVIERHCGPGRLDRATCSGDARPRLTSMNRDSHGRARKVKSSLTGDVGKTQRVGRRRHEHRGFELEQILHALLAAHGAARDAQRAEPLSATEGGPEAKERTKGESQEDTVCPRNGAGAGYVGCPDPRAPLPRLGGTE